MCLFAYRHKVGRVATKSPYNAHLYVGFTDTRSGGLGRAFVSALCASARQTRVSINRFAKSGTVPKKNEILYTAEVTVNHNNISRTLQPQITYK